MDFPNAWATPKVSHTEKDWWVSAFYGFATVDNPEAVKTAMADRLAGTRVYGSILVAPEGANGTLCAPTQALPAGKADVTEEPGVGGWHWECWEG